MIFLNESILILKKNIIFDFDGTLANTFDTIVDIANQFSREFGYDEITNESLQEIQNLNSREIVKLSKISVLKIPALLYVVKNELNKHIQTIQPIDGIDSVLRTLGSMGHQLGIVSSNSQENIYQFIDLHQWNDIFNVICCGTTIFGKAQVLSKLLKTQNLSADEVIYLGDETRDIDAAKKVNIKVIGVTWGFNSRSVLAAHDPDFLIDRPEEILDVIAQL